MYAPPVENASAYPRVYRASGGWLFALILCGLMLGVGGIVGAWFSATASLGNPRARFWLIGLCVVFATLGIYCVLSTLRSRVVLFADPIEVNELSGSEVLGREEIRGWRSLATTPPGFLLIPRDSRHRAVKVAQVFRIDPEFANWLHTIPCLDRVDGRASKAEIRNNTSLGATPGERMKALALGRRRGKILAVFAGLAMLWGFLYPRPYELAIVILAALPWIALLVVKRSHGLFRVDTNRNDAHPNVAIAVIFPSLTLLLRSVMDYTVLPSLAAAWSTMGIGGVLGFSIFRVDPSTRGKLPTVVALLAFSLVYGYGVGIEANALLDRSPDTNYDARVEGKRIIRGKTTTYELDLAPWGPKTLSNKLRVGSETYNFIQRGDVAHLTLKQGALGVNLD